MSDIISDEQQKRSTHVWLCDHDHCVEDMKPCSFCPNRLKDPWSTGFFKSATKIEMIPDTYRCRTECQACHKLCCYHCRAPIFNYGADFFHRKVWIDGVWLCQPCSDEGWGFRKYKDELSNEKYALVKN